MKSTRREGWRIKEGEREKEWNLDASLMAKEWIESRDWERETELGDRRTVFKDRTD